MGILGHPALKAKQPLHVRLSRIDANRRDSARRREPKAWECQITPKRWAPHVDVVVALQQAFRRASSGSFNLPPPSEKDIQRHAVKDVEQMRSVFDLYDRDQSGTLDHMEMKGFLREVGLKATTQTERSEIQKMVALGPMEITFDEVVTRTVPIMRYIIVEVNRAHIKQMFTEADEDCSGLLTVKELKRILHIMGIFPSQQQINVALAELVLVDDFKSISGEILDTRDILSFDNFVQLVPQLQEMWERSRFERVRELAKSYELEQDVQELWDLDLLDIKEAYDRFSGNSSRMLDQPDFKSWYASATSSVSGEGSCRMLRSCR